MSANTHIKELKHALLLSQAFNTLYALTLKHCQDALVSSDSYKTAVDDRAKDDIYWMIRHHSQYDFNRIDSSICGNKQGVTPESAFEAADKFQALIDDAVKGQNLSNEAYINAVIAVATDITKSLTVTFSEQTTTSGKDNFFDDNASNSLISKACGKIEFLTQSLPIKLNLTEYPQHDPYINIELAIKMPRRLTFDDALNQLYYSILNTAAYYSVWRNIEQKQGFERVKLAA